jgi:hypothetical protein
MQYAPSVARRQDVTTCGAIGRQQGAQASCRRAAGPYHHATRSTCNPSRNSAYYTDTYICTQAGLPLELLAASHVHSPNVGASRSAACQGHPAAHAMYQYAMHDHQSRASGW